MAAPPCERVLYILGAGFSAPLGIPIMSNFLSVSKDVCLGDPERYGYFQTVFDRIREMAVCKNFLHADLSNIEEILSILEMEASVEDSASRDDFVRYILDVVDARTPDTSQPSWPNELELGLIFGHEKLAHLYGNFAACCHGLQALMHVAEPIELTFAVTSQPEKLYSVVTLNYDLVLENACKHIARSSSALPDLSFQGPPSSDVDNAWSPPSMAKLHGSVATGVVIPPTWNKSIDRTILPHWRLAYRLIAEANHIRILGYSLPDTDAYIRYLLKAALMHSKHLKSWDVVCLDRDGSVKRRYDAFITFPSYRFRRLSTEAYLANGGMAPREIASTFRVDRTIRFYRFLEQAHEIALGS